MMREPTARKPIAESELVVVGNIRNGADQIGAVVGNIQRALDDFKKVSFFVVESDSSDETVSELERLKAVIPNFDFVSLGALGTTMPKRTERLAHCRNRSLDEIIHNEVYASADYVAMTDLDGLNLLLSIEGIRTCWDTPVDWDVVTANQQGYYYDIWALRHSSWCPVDCWKQYWQLVPIFGEHRARKIAVWSRMELLDPQAGWIEVDSAFGGFAIYKRNAFVSGRYAGLDETGHEVCDHVAFHADLRNKGFRIYINAALINALMPRDLNL